ncbi:MAG: hypothetical protein E7597_04850 [Ruminococcaceae bacterium]|nr:hypothetical protein [Oscillospiraceae bacterium]
MTKLKRTLSLVLCLVLCLSLVPAGLVNAGGEAETSSHVYMIFTNPGEDCTTEMRIGFHSDYLYTDCYVEYTTSDDTGFRFATRADGSYDDQKYLWFYNRLTTNALSDSRFGTKFLDWGVELYDLTPDTEYIYRVCDGNGAYSKTYTFKTAGAEEYSIIWMSDAHVNEGYTGRINAWRNMFKFAETQAKYDIGFQFSTGDTTTSGDRYADWLTVANEEFTQKYMIANLVGNHDVYDSIMDDDTVYYTQYWKSGQYFEIVQNNPRNGYTALSNRINGYLNTDNYQGYANQSANEMISVDTGVHSGKQISGAMDNTDGRMYWFNYNRILFIIFEYYSMMSGPDTKNALDWAGSVIEENYGNYDYIICANHVNLINGGGGAFRDYGATDYEYFGPFFDKYGVDMFLAGDNHVYLRTNPIYGGEVSTDPNKGTYIIQAPCLSRPQNFTAKDPAGYAVKQYSMSGTTVGGLVIDVDENGLTFNCLVYEMLGETPYYCYDSFTVPKRDRAPSAQVGYYKLNGPEKVCSSPSASYGEEEIDFTDYTMYVYDTYMNYGLVLGAGIATWVDLSDATFICGGTREGGIGYLPVEIEPEGYNNTATIYTKEQFETMTSVAVLSDPAPALFEGMYFYSLHGDGTDFYSVMASYTDYHDWTACESCEAVLVCGKSFNIGNILTLDRINGNMLVAIASANFSETIPEGIVYAAGNAITVVGGNASFPGGVTVAELDERILNAKVVVAADGNELKSWDNVPNGATVTVYNGNSDTAVGSFTVSVPTYTVSFLAEDGALIEAQTVSYGCDAVAPAAPEKEGFEFAGWTANYRNVTGDVETTATYTEVEEDDSSTDGPSGDYTPILHGNRLAGESYTYTSMNGFQGACKDDNATLLTDGVVRGTNNMLLGGQAFITVELNGTNQENIIDFTLNGAREIASVVIKGARKVNELSSVNRHCNIASIYYSTDGLSFKQAELTITEKAIDGAPLYTEDNGATNYNQFYNITATFSEAVENVVALRVILNTARADGSRGYIVQLDEIEAYGAEGPLEEEPEDPSSDEPSEDIPSVEPSEDVPSSEPSEDVPPVEDSYLTVEDNLLLGKDYTVVSDATVSKADSGNQMTNGAIRGDKDNAWANDLAVQGVSVEWFGTSKTITYTFTFDEATDVSEIVFRNVRIASNRAFGTVVVNDTNIVMSGQWTKTPVAGAPLYGIDGTSVDQYFDVSISVELTGITELKIALITDMYVCQYDEIMAFGAAGDEPSSDAEPSEESSELTSSEDSEESSDVISEETSDVISEETSDVISEETSDVVSEDSEETSDDETSDDTADVVYGDVNGDGAVNSLDAAQTLKHDAKLITLDDAALAAADVNGDGTVNSLDAAQVLKFDAKLITSFPVENSADEESSEELSVLDSSDAIVNEEESDENAE